MSKSLMLILTDYAESFLNRRQDGVVGKSPDSRAELCKFKSHVCCLLPVAHPESFALSTTHYFYP